MKIALVAQNATPLRPRTGSGPDSDDIGLSELTRKLAGHGHPALALYRQHFRPSEILERPYAMVAAAVVCAETDERARFLAGSGALSFLRLRAGRPGPLPSPEEAAAYPYNELERAFVEDRQASNVIGSPETV